MDQYLNLLHDVLINGKPSADRTGVGTIRVFGRQMRFDLNAGFPLVTTKKMFFKGIVHELLWIISGSTNIRYLVKNGVHIWDAWSDPYGDLGPVYGRQWRHWESVSLVPIRHFDPPVVTINTGLIAGVGVNAGIRPGNEHLYSIWNEMLHRCYDPTRKHYQWYGGVGVHVDERWHDFANFLVDVKTLPGWRRKALHPDDYSLDKDMSASNKYGPDTCEWISIKEQNLNTSRATLVEVFPPDSPSFMTMDITDLCERFNLDHSTVYKCIRGERKSHNGFTFRVAEVPLGVVPRWRVVDQLQNAIDLIKTDPTSRRLLVNAWNVGEIDEMALPPCHYAYQFFVEDGKLSCMMNQRSADTFLGTPFNIASYALLTHMVAQVCDLGVGELVIVMADTHIYQNHVEQVALQLTREPLALSRLELNPEIKNIDDFTFDDIKLVGYVSHPAIHGDIAI